MIGSVDGGWVPTANSPAGIGGAPIGRLQIGGPSGFPTAAGVPKITPAVVFWQYADDEDIQGLFAAYNLLAQSFLDWGLATSLGDYRTIAQALLDWISEALYGLARPLLQETTSQLLGAINTVPVNSLAINAGGTTESIVYYATTDDLYRRILTWHAYRGDGRFFTIRWLKRRIWRFLFGANGSGGNEYQSGVLMGFDQNGDPVYWPSWFEADDTRLISVVFGASPDVTITIAPTAVSIESGPVNAQAVNSLVINGGAATSQSQPIPAMAAPFKAAVDNGVLELPFQYNWTVQIG